VGGPLFAKLVRFDRVIVASSTAWFARRPTHSKPADLRRRGVRLHALDIGGDLAGDGLKQLKATAAAFAESERNIGDRLGEAIRRHTADQKARGRYAGGKVPFRFRRKDDGRLVRHKDEQNAIREMTEMKADRKSLRAIAAAMVAKGHKISHAGVAGILKTRKHDVWKVESSRAQARSRWENDLGLNQWVDEDDDDVDEDVEFSAPEV